MEYPLKIDVNITQDDYIEVEILEQALDMELWKKSLVKTFAIETAVMALLSVLIVYLSSRGVIIMRTIYFVLFFYMLFAFHFVYTYFQGAKREFNMAVQHLLMNKDTNEFFTPEKGI